jgi:hypothetical protein
MSGTRTYVIMDVPEHVYDEIAKRFRAAGYDHVFHRDRHGKVVIDMNGVALNKRDTVRKPKEVSTFQDQ